MNNICWLYELAQIYKVQRKQSLTSIIFEEIVKLYLNLILQLYDSNTKQNFIESNVTFDEDSNLITTIHLFANVLDYLSKLSLA